MNLDWLKERWNDTGHRSMIIGSFIGAILFQVSVWFVDREVSHPVVMYAWSIWMLIYLIIAYLYRNNP
jgi:hypothetical protein